MKIIIVGCGKVGYTLVEQLGSEDHDIVVIDEKPEKVSTITNNLDAMGIVGNGINHQTLIDAGITTADLLIAVTMRRICSAVSSRERQATARPSRVYEILYIIRK